MCNDSKVIQKGVFFDLMYANIWRETMDCYKQYAFMRYFQNELWLIVANFDDVEADIQVLIPAHVFDYFDIINRPIKKASNVLTSQYCSPCLEGDSFYPVHIPALDATIIKFQFAKEKWVLVGYSFSFAEKEVKVDIL